MSIGAVALLAAGVIWELIDWATDGSGTPEI